MLEEITVRDVTAHPIAAVRARVPLEKVGAKFGPHLDKVWAVIRSGTVDKHGHNVFVYHHAGDSDGETDVEFGVQVASSFADVDDVVCSQTPAGKAAHAAFYGDYSGLATAHRALIDWCTEQGLTRSGINWEVYGDFEEDPAKRRTDVFHLLKP